MYGGLECAGILRRGALQGRVSIRGYESPLVQVFLSLEWYVEGRFFAFTGYRKASGAVEDGVDLGVLPELVHRYEGVTECGYAAYVPDDDTSPHA